MNINLKKLSKTPNPVLYIHTEINEDVIATLVNDKWLDAVYEAAIKGGFLDPHCTPAGQEMGFMPHSHIDVDSNGNEVKRAPDFIIPLDDDDDDE